MTIELTERAIHTAESTAYMFGRDSFYDGPCARDYDPWEHANDLGVPIIYRDDLRNDIDACYSEKYRAIFCRPNLHISVERFALAHELVHHEHGDVGQDSAQERRADRIAARRLIRPSALAELAEVTDDLGRMALELKVPEHAMAVFLSEYGNG